MLRKPSQGVSPTSGQVSFTTMLNPHTVQRLENAAASCGLSPGHYLDRLFKVSGALSVVKGGKKKRKD